MEIKELAKGAGVVAIMAMPGLGYLAGPLLVGWLCIQVFGWAMWVGVVLALIVGAVLGNWLAIGLFLLASHLAAWAQRVEVPPAKL